MKILNKNAKNLTNVVTLMSLLMIGFYTPNAFANSVSASTYSPNAESPSFSNHQCDFTGNYPACAYSLSSGIDQLYASSASSTVESATAYNNEGFSGYGTTPALTSSQSVIDYNAYISYSGV